MKRKIMLISLMGLFIAFSYSLCRGSVSHSAEKKKIFIPFDVTDNGKLNGMIRSVVCDKEGNVYAAGNFRNANGRYYVARWDQKSLSWIELGGINSLAAPSIIQRLTVDKNNNIIAVGDFNNRAGKKYVAIWNRDTNLWSELGGINSLSGSSTIFSVHADAQGNVYAGGNFLNDSENRYVAVWDGSSWKELGRNNRFSKRVSTSGAIFGISSDQEGNVYAIGEFKNKNGHTYVAKWDKHANSWGELGGANSFLGNGTINCISTDKDGNIYVAGAFKNSRGKFYVAKWSKSTNMWSEIGEGSSLTFNGFIRALTSDSKGNIYVAGAFKNSKGKFYVAKWNSVSNNWSEVAKVGNELQVNDVILSIIVDMQENVYVGGNFKNSDGFHYVATWDGVSWRELIGTMVTP